MYWFLYDKDLRNERVNSFHKNVIATKLSILDACRGPSCACKSEYYKMYRVLTSWINDVILAIAVRSVPLGHFHALL